MRVLVTGGAGFIGAHVVEHLLKNTDWDIVILDKLTYAANGFDRLRDIQVFSEHQHRVKMFVTDLYSGVSCGMAKEIGKVDYVIHMAAETHVDNSITDPLSFVRANVMGTAHLLEYIRSYLPDIEKFVYFSTDEVFGPARQSPSPGEIMVFGDQLGMNLELQDTYREWDRYNSTNPYSATKAAGEELCLAWSNTYKIPLIVTHTMNAFGERQHPEKFIPKVVRSILRGQLITIHASPDCTKSGSRSYIHCRNIASAMLFLLQKALPVPLREKFNVVGEQEISNLDLVKLIHQILCEFMDLALSLDYEMVDFHSSRPGHDLRYSLDGSKIKIFGWESPQTFEQSLRNTIHWMIQPHNIKWLLL